MKYLYIYKGYTHTHTHTYIYKGFIYILYIYKGFPGSSADKESTCNAGDPA